MVQEKFTGKYEEYMYDVLETISKCPEMWGLITKQEHKSIPFADEGKFTVSLQKKYLNNMKTRSRFKDLGSDLSKIKQGFSENCEGWVLPYRWR